MKRTPLKKMGKDKARETRKYWPLRRQFLEANPYCEFPDRGSPSCINRSNQIHHMKGQNWRIMNDTTWWMGVCIECHAYIESHKNEMREKGIILYK